MTDRPDADAGAPRLSAIQLAWLQEIGVDKRLLARFISPKAKAPQSAVSLLPSSAGSEAPEAPEAPVAPVAPVTAAGLLQRPSQPAGRPAAIPAAPAVVQPVEKKRLPDKGGERAPLGPIPQELGALQTFVSECQACSLHGERGQIVFGSGAQLDVDWLVIGEAPGERDDRVGLPFQGKAGDLLRNMMACIQDSDVSVSDPDGSASGLYYTNVIKCRPRGNRKPRAEEIAACMPFLHRQISLMRPRRLLLLGHLAAQAVLATDRAFEDLRGEVQHYKTEEGGSIPAVVTYHPAALLARPQDKARSWADLILARHAAERAAQ